MVFFALIGLRPGQAQDRSIRDDLTPPRPVRKPAGLQEWVDGGILRFRVDAITDCGAASNAANQLNPRAKADAGTVGTGRPIPFRTPVARLAVSVQIIAGATEVFVSPRDVTLEAGGVILPSSDPTTALGLRCAPVLKARRLAARQSVRGLVVFEVSPEFRGAKAPMILAYRPTRWGGAGRLEVKLPGCLEACKESP